MRNASLALVGWKPSAKQQTSDAGTFLLCTPRQWGVAVLSGLIVSGLLWPWYGDISIWIGVVLFLMAATMVHMIFTYGLIVFFPHIAILVTGLQYVVAAWLSFYYPSSNPLYNIGARVPVYLSYAGWVVIVVCLAWALSFWGLKLSHAKPTAVSAKLLAELDVLFWIGIVTKLTSHWMSFGPLNFVFLLCADFRYLGALGRMIVSGPGWKWRILLTLAMEMMFATGEGMFHSLLLWGTAVFAIYIYKTRPRRIVVIAFMCLGFLALPALQQAKWSLREKTWSGDSTGGGLANLGNALDLSKNIGSGVIKTASGGWDADLLGGFAMRFNQGWIIDRVMQTVPSHEPYAKGETLLEAIEAAVLPRLLDPDKVRAGGFVNAPRYAGLSLGGGTSMNLGYAGEMYANFGLWAGIAGCFLYAFLLSMMFRWAFKRAALNPLWWAFVPYVGLTGLKAEEGIAEVLNWLVKATVVSAVIYYNFPAIRAALSGACRRDQRGVLRKPRRVRLRFPRRDWFRIHSPGGGCVCAGQQATAQSGCVQIPGGNSGGVAEPL
jgi:hypothetical protein